MATLDGSEAENALLQAITDAGGAGLSLISLDHGTAAPDRRTQQTAPGVIRVGTHHSGPLPTDDLDSFDILLSADPEAPRPWVGAPAGGYDAALAEIQGAIKHQPVAAAVAAQVLRMSLKLTFDEAFVLESLAYSMLLGASDFRAWRARTPVRVRGDHDGPRVALAFEDGTLDIRLTRPRARNAVDALMRDALCEALEVALDHLDAPPVMLSGEGPSFSAGGDLDEFGQAQDAGCAHLIRGLRAPARLIYQMRDRVTVRVQGACIGAGIEIPAAAGQVIAQPGAFFRLPELSMGLIPGAGGTASIPRRIGRQRACYMAISGNDIDAATALGWGLIDGVDEGAV